RPAVTPEQRKEQAAALHESIAVQVQALRDSDRWAAFLRFTAAFHTYSLNNVLLILSQRPDAERVAGFRTWQSLGRQVRKGEKALRIFGYSTKKVTEQDDNGDDIEKRYPRFPILPVFDIAQTDPIDPDAAAPSTLTAPLTGTDDHGVIAALTDFLVADGWSVEH
ncbi:ArdC family protein, partial [Paraburkholderia sp. BR14264]|uniref:ArdC family protein n=1 Tax=Paraburkholderia sp. BR14264 TaxID=3237001 RepID=UPI00397D4186